jgi:hypothetical protein
VYHPTAAVNGGSVCIGYPYSLLDWVPQRGQSWVLPVDTRRMVGAQTAVDVSVEQLKEMCANRLGAVLDVVVGDGSFGKHLFLGQIKHLPCAAVVGLRCDRMLYAEPGPYSGWGRPRVHGARFAFKEPDTRGQPDEELWFCDSRFGLVHLRCWYALHAKQDASTAFWVIRAETHLERSKPPTPIWLAALGTPHKPNYLKWLWCDPRWPIEPAIRFRKNHLCWTLPRFQHADACDRWTCLVDLAHWQVWLARSLVSDQPLPWQKPQVNLTPGCITPGLGALFAQFEHTTAAPKTREKSPGWPSDRQHSRPRRYPVLKRD